jgi:hypothetical protein
MTDFDTAARQEAERRHPAATRTPGTADAFAAGALWAAEQFRQAQAEAEDEAKVWREQSEADLASLARAIEDAEHAEAERDAALAEVERVRRLIPAFERLYGIQSSPVARLRAALRAWDGEDRS